MLYPGGILHAVDGKLHIEFRGIAVLVPVLIDILSYIHVFSNGGLLIQRDIIGDIRQVSFAVHLHFGDFGGQVEFFRYRNGFRTLCGIILYSVIGDGDISRRVFCERVVHGELDRYALIGNGLVGYVLSQGGIIRNRYGSGILPGAFGERIGFKGCFDGIRVYLCPGGDRQGADHADGHEEGNQLPECPVCMFHFCTLLLVSLPNTDEIP